MKPRPRLPPPWAPALLPPIMSRAALSGFSGMSLLRKGETTDEKPCLPAITSGLALGTCHDLGIAAGLPSSPSLEHKLILMAPAMFQSRGSSPTSPSCQVFLPGRASHLHRGLQEKLCHTWLMEIRKPLLEWPVPPCCPCSGAETLPLLKAQTSQEAILNRNEQI